MDDHGFLLAALSLVCFTVIGVEALRAAARRREADDREAAEAAHRARRDGGL